MIKKNIVQTIENSMTNLTVFQNALTDTFKELEDLFLSVWNKAPTKYCNEALKSFKASSFFNDYFLDEDDMQLQFKKFIYGFRKEEIPVIRQKFLDYMNEVLKDPDSLALPVIEQSKNKITPGARDFFYYQFWFSRKKILTDELKKDYEQAFFESYSDQNIVHQFIASEGSYYLAIEIPKSFLENPWLKKYEETIHGNSTLEGLILGHYKNFSLKNFSGEDINFIQTKKEDGSLYYYILYVLSPDPKQMKLLSTQLIQEIAYQFFVKNNFLSPGGKVK